MKNRKPNLLSPLFKSSLGIGLLVAGLAQASDHIDFTGGNGNNVIPRELDLTDLFAWVPAPGRLVLGLDTNLAATLSNQFSNSHLYRFRIRKLSIDSKSAESIIVPVVQLDSPEFTINCKVTGNKAKCSSDKVIAEAELNNEVSEDTIATTGARLFAGLRADPFILDIGWAGKYTKLTASTNELPTGSIPFPLQNPANFSDYLNVLNFTLELDTTKLFGGPVEFIGVAADVIEQTPGAKIVDRVGRPEITNMTIRADAIKEIYNMVDTYNLTSQESGTFQAYIGAGVSGWDRLNKVIDWQPAALEKFKQTLVNDFLVVNLNGKCTEKNTKSTESVFIDSSYLDIETNRKIGGSFRSCGGRTPTEDIIDTLVSYYTGGPGISNLTYGDGVYKVRNSATTSWPYFAKPIVKEN